MTDSTAGIRCTCFLPLNLVRRSFAASKVTPPINARDAAHSPDAMTCTPPRRRSSARLKWGAATLTSPPSSSPPVPHYSLADQVARLTREHARLQQQLTNAETIIAIQKVATLLKQPTKRLGIAREIAHICSKSHGLNLLSPTSAAVAVLNLTQSSFAVTFAGERTVNVSGRR